MGNDGKTRKGTFDVVKSKKPKEDRSEEANSSAAAPPHITAVLTEAEAEIMLLVSQNSGATIRDLYNSHGTYFDGTRSRSRISEILTGIEKKQDKWNRRYLERSPGRPATFSIPSQDFVDERPTGLLLLEIRNGYKRLNRTGDIPLTSFIDYVVENYKDELTDIEKRLELCVVAGLIEFVDRNVRSGTIREIRESRHLRNDLKYLVLLAKLSLSDLRTKRSDLEVEEERLDPNSRQFARMKRKIGEKISVRDQVIDHISKLIATFAI